MVRRLKFKFIVGVDQATWDWLQASRREFSMSFIVRDALRSYRAIHEKATDR